MRFLFLAIILISFLVSCSPPREVTIEEQVLRRSYEGFIVALTYDEICNGNDPKTIFDTERKESSMFFGHQNMLIARLGGLHMMHNPKLSMDESIQQLLEIRNKIKVAAKARLEAAGCDSEVGNQLGKAYEFYSRVHPAMAMEMIDKRIEEEGGTVSSFDEIESKIEADRGEFLQ